MKNEIARAATIFMGFFAIMNPIANVPVFLGLTMDEDNKTTAMIALRALIIAFIIVVIFAVTGKLVFKIFGITLPAFKITGGLLVFLVGFHMVQGNHSSVQHPKENNLSKEAALSIAVSPLAMPILAGPGTIVTAINFSAGESFLGMILVVSMFFLLCVITYLFFIFGKRMVAYLGDNALGIITRMMGLILAVIGTQMIIEGIKGAIKLT